MTAGRGPSTHRASALVSPDVWETLSDDERIAVRCVDLHLLRRFRQSRYEPLETIDGERCGIFWTDGYVQGLLRELGYRKTGEKFAAEVIAIVQRLGILGDTRQVKKPRRDEQSIAAAEKFQPDGTEIAREGGEDAQPSVHRSYWRRVFRVVPLQLVLHQYRRLGAYDSGHVLDVPHHLAFLSAWAKRQGLISRPRRLGGARRGSVQCAFGNTGPP